MILPRFPSSGWVFGEPVGVGSRCQGAGTVSTTSEDGQIPGEYG